ncbi:MULTISPECIES: DUF1203 domain-containing protein [Streptomyces]|uniref:DUF1203 domain-containing protein n=1 Tax=Streptomyces katrae TaxID=68223 RepID=A0ABT7GTU2_9ACTN|nr:MULTISPECIES: DUF1203 domain-containing protein [Streptomyces]MDK9497002.1 DUF1203 domain-containing protein [Streptomyces katrae]RST01556.1 DUF1203 domain-containing protein [Streptomyces sp. WAC07149]GLX18508.1 hypothetical protein Slala01_21520 [Streptomyces lavendulae subsp. lavendulae]GLX30269.1 hypothetical protein Slala02_60890 [Streptomyces lavendulae subsp. lavendulae]
MTTTHTALPIPPAVLASLRLRDDAGRPCTPYEDPEGGAPLRCCLRRSRPGELIALVSYAPLRRWAAATGADPGAYDEQGPVFVHGAECPGPAAGSGHPFANAGALRTVRRYDAAGRILGGRVLALPEAGAGAGDAAVERALSEAFADPDTALVHVRAAEYGCFLFEVRRA